MPQNGDPTDLSSPLPRDGATQANITGEGAITVRCTASWQVVSPARERAGRRSGDQLARSTRAATLRAGTRNPGGRAGSAQGAAPRGLRRRDPEGPRSPRRRPVSLRPVSGEVRILSDRQLGTPAPGRRGQSPAGTGAFLSPVVASIWRRRVAPPCHSLAVGRGRCVVPLW